MISKFASRAGRDRPHEIPIVDDRADTAEHDAPKARDDGSDIESTGLALGIEKVGLPPIYWPLPSAILAVVLCILAAIGVTQLKVDDSLSQLFRSDTEEFRQFEEVTARFPSAEFDVIAFSSLRTAAPPRR